MANSLAIANLSGLSAAQNQTDLNAVRLYEREKLIRYSVTLTGNYATHVRGQNVGEVLDFTKTPTNANFSPEQLWGYRGPVRVYVLNTGGNGYSMSIVPGADSLHWLLCIFTTAVTEFTAGAYSAQLLADQDILIEASGRNFD